MLAAVNALVKQVPQALVLLHEAQPVPNLTQQIKKGLLLFHLYVFP